MSERTVKDWAAYYVARGWHVVPLVPRGKDCWHERWQERDFGPESFEDDSNIGIKSTDGLVVVDEDCPEVVKVADAFLPPTGAVWGRASKPRSKRVYLCPSLGKKIVFTDSSKSDTNKPVMLELRTGKHQDMAPPSTHPDGEVLSWVGGEPGDVAEVPAAQLVRAVRLCVTAALVGRYYPPPGKRHSWFLALAGALRRLECAVEEAALVVEQAGIISGEPKPADRRAEVRTTYAKDDDDPVTSFKTLADEAGQQFITTLRQVWGEDSSGGISRTKLEELNKKHAVVFQQNGELVVITEDVDADSRPFLRYSSFQTIRDLYPQQVIVGSTARGTPVGKKLGDLWLNSPHRRFYQGIELAPNGRQHPGYYNLWRGFSVEPKAGSWRLFERHIREVIAGDDEHIFDYVISWMASAVQEPGNHAHTAIVLRGGQGTGKTSFATWFGSMFGPHFVHLDSTRHLTGHFNAHLHNAILVFADEAAWPGDKQGAGALKRMVTENTILIERKGMDALQVPNLMHLLLASNETWVWPAAVDERRGVIIDVDPRRRNDRNYFGMIERELFREGGLAAMLKDLLELKIQLDLREIPKTKALFEQKQLSASPQQRWWYEELREGTMWREPDRDAEGYWLDRDLVYDRYIKVIEKVRSRSDQGLKTELGMFLHKVLPTSYPREKRKLNGGRYWVLPPLSACRRAYEKLFNVAANEAQWLGEQAELSEGEDSREL